MRILFGILIFLYVYSKMEEKDNKMYSKNKNKPKTDGSKTNKSNDDDDGGFFFFWF